MIAFADDLTGAAEIGGVAWRYGLPASIAINHVPEVSSGLLIVDTETRTLEPPDAVERMRRLRRRAYRTDLFFFKIDSALRGPILPQVRTAMHTRVAIPAMILPANPSRGRTMEDGIYRVEGVPIAETEFANDPDHPVRSSRIRDLLPGVEPLGRWQQMEREADADNAAGRTTTVDGLDGLLEHLSTVRR